MVELKGVALRDGDLSYAVRVLQGTVPKETNPATLFIDPVVVTRRPAAPPAGGGRGPAPGPRSGPGPRPVPGPAVGLGPAFGPVPVAPVWPLGCRFSPHLLRPICRIL